MLNLSNNRIEGRIDRSKYRSFGMVREFSASKTFMRLLAGSFLLFVIILFLPWTQNFRSKGFVTTLAPDQRPQHIHTVIAGRIEKWFVREGSFVEKGDTILYISEIKDDYFDPNLLARTEDQIKAKELTVNSYMEKVKAIDAQIDALFQTKKLKMQQAENHIRQAKLKILSDSVDLEAAMTNYEIAQRQYARMEKLYEDGLKSLTDLETRKLKLQETMAKKISADNMLLKSRNELINALMERSSVENQYKDKLAQSEAEKYATMSNLYDAEAVVTKMQNQYMNYSVRQGLYYITAPQSGYVTKTVRTGIGETIKAGAEVVSIMPGVYDLAVSMYVNPVDLPLLQIGQPIRFMFDGWPSVVFSGWPNLSFGTFGGKVVAIDNFTSDNGKYRILVAPDPEDKEWPKQLRVGAGANGLALLKDVPVWYELWRQLNGFPPDYYHANVDPVSRALGKDNEESDKEE